jgi:chromosome segregation ATPase
MAENDGTLAEGTGLEAQQVETTDGTVAEQATPQLSPEELQAEYQKVKSEKQSLESRIGEIESRRKQENQAITRLAKERDDARQMLELLNKKINVIGQSGYGDAEIGTKLAAIDNEYAQGQAKNAQTEYQEHVTSVTSQIQSVLQKAGINPNEATPETQRVHALWDKAVKSGQPLDYVLEVANVIAEKHVKPSAEQASKKDEIKKRNLRVDTSGYAAGVNLANMSPGQLIAEGLKDLKRKTE